MLLRLGIASSMYERAQHELVITGENVARFASSSASPTRSKRARLTRLLGGYKRTLNRERFVATSREL
jgi:ribonucleoside-diphosphate reductase alpha chain